MFGESSMHINQETLTCNRNLKSFKTSIKITNCLSILKLCRLHGSELFK